MTITPTLPFERPDPMRPPPEYARLHQSTPVASVLTPDGQRAWLVTSYDAATAVLADRRFGLAPPGEEQPGNDTLFQDGPTHTRLRRLVSAAFTPRSIAVLRPRVEQLADEHVAALARKGPPADLVTDLGAPLSITVIGELLGVAVDQRGRFRSMVDAMSSADFLFAKQEDLAVAAQAWNDLSGYIAEIIAAKRKEPGDDLLSALTACNAITVGTIQLLLHGRLADLATCPPEQADAIVEEVLRLQSGRTGEPMPRYAREDLHLAGVSISAGDLVLVRLEAAGRDPEHFADPDQFIPDRGSSPTLVFGHGLHYCLGAALARIEVRAALSALARRLPGLQLRDRQEDIVWTPSSVDIGPEALHVTW